MSESLEIDDSTLWLDSKGDDRQVVLFIHAGVADSRMWNSQFEAIDGQRLIRFDMRGYGRSRLGSQRFTNRDDATAVLDHLGIDRAVVVGCSIGGYTALQLAEAAPERLDGVVLVAADAPGFDPGIDYESPEWPQAVEAFQAGDLRLAADLEAEMWLAGIDRTCSELDGETVDLFVAMDLIALENEAARDELENGIPLEELPRIDVPVEVMVGSRDIPQVLAAAEHLASHLSDERPRVIDNAAHLPSMDQPGAFNDALTGFLASI